MTSQRASTGDVPSSQSKSTGNPQAARDVCLLCAGSSGGNDVIRCHGCSRSVHMKCISKEYQNVHGRNAHKNSIEWLCDFVGKMNFFTCVQPAVICRQPCQRLRN